MEDAGWLFSEDAYPGRQSLTCFLLRPTCDIFAALKWSLGMEITLIKDEQGIFFFFFLNVVQCVLGWPKVCPTFSIRSYKIPK